jgi:glycerol-3-phosphate dehydrogenase (NAD(P)+)
MSPAADGTVAVLGAGNMGTALAHQIAGNGHLVRAWSIETDVLEEIRDHHRNTKYLDGVALSYNIHASFDLTEAAADAALIVVSVPSQVVHRIAHDLAACIEPGQVVLNVAKGMYEGRRMSQVLVDALGESAAATTGSMGGPAIAIEMAKDIPTAVIISVPEEAACRRVQRLLQNDSLKVEATTDVVGLELCATMKNVYAIGLGMCDGLGYGTNTKAFLTSIALSEMSDVCTAFGGRPQTASGLAGMGDLLTTGFSRHSRNRSLGEKMAGGGDWQEFLRTNTVEGVEACKAVKDLTQGQAIETHLLDTIYEMLFLERSPEESVRHFFTEFAY